MGTRRNNVPQDGPTFSEWIERYERQQEVRNSQIDALSQNVSALTADVRTLMKNQEALFTKSNRPFQWSAFVAAISLAVVMITLIIAPMKEQVLHGAIFDQEVVEYIKSNEYERGRDESNREWMKDRMHILENYVGALQESERSRKDGSGY